MEKKIKKWMGHTAVVMHANKPDIIWTCDIVGLPA
jgi:hypothetical protein